MSKAWIKLGLWSGLGLSLGLLVLVVGIWWSRSREKSWRGELSLALDAMRAGRYGRAGERLSRLAEHWTNQGEVLLLLGECEFLRGRREEAMAAWAKIRPTEGSFARAVQFRASNLIELGKYTAAEEILLPALASLGQAGSYDLERELTQLYRLEGRFDDMRRVLRASWCRSPDPVRLLRELWMLDHSATAVEVWKFALDHADNGDDRVWLGRAHHAILTGRFRAAAEWLEGCLSRSPDDPKVWRARLDLALATDDVAGLWTAAASLPADHFDAIEIQELRVWLAAHTGDNVAERQELMALVRNDPGNAQALERLAVLATQSGQMRDAEQLRRRKAEVDRALYRLNKILLDGGIDPGRAETLGRLAVELGRSFDAQAWAILAEAMLAGSDPAEGSRSRSGSPSDLTRNLKAKAFALSSPFATLPESSATGSLLGDRLADLRVAKPRRDTLTPVGPTVDEPTRGTPEFVDDAAAVGLQFAFDNGRTPSACCRRRSPEELACSTTTVTAGSMCTACRAATSLRGKVARRKQPGPRATVSFATAATARSWT